MGQPEDSQHPLAIIGLRPDMSTAESLRRKRTSGGVCKRGGHRFLFYAYGSGALALPLCYPRLRVAMAYAVLLPERFRGCCTFGATTLSRWWTLPRCRSSSANYPERLNDLL